MHLAEGLGLEILLTFRVITTTIILLITPATSTTTSLGILSEDTDTYTPVR
jgi:hypothetical protein